MDRQQGIDECSQPLFRGLALFFLFLIFGSYPILFPTDKLRGYFLNICRSSEIEYLAIEIVVVWLIWAILWTFDGPRALPGSYIFAVATLTTLSYIVGAAVVTLLPVLLPGHFMIGLGLLARYTFLPELEEMGDLNRTAIDYVK